MEEGASWQMFLHGIHQKSYPALLSLEPDTLPGRIRILKSGVY